MIIIKNTNREEILKFNNLYTGTRKAKILHTAFVIICIITFVSLTFLIKHLSVSKVDYYVLFNSITINRYTLSGIIAQGQVITAILITLSPVRGSYRIALLLCAFSCLGALSSIIIDKNINSLPGIVVPVTSAAICIVINRYGRNLNKQVHRVLDYSRIVKKNEEMLHQLAFYDSLTGLPNRKMIMDQIELMTDQEDNKTMFDLVYLDLDNFKKINDSMGHKVGDIILKEVANRWKAQCHSEDLLGRVGGDEFLILIRNSMDTVELTHYLNQFQEVLKEPIIIERKEFYINASFGITSYPADGNNVDELMQNADIALYKAKNLGKNDYQFYNKEMYTEVIKRIQLENGLKTAISNGEFYMVFQPQYVSGTNKLRGFEALARWKHPKWGMISPAEFIPVAEETGIIIDMGRWIIETVLGKFIEFKEQYNFKTIVSINISVAQILEPSFVFMIKEILKKTGFDSKYLELEITESLFIAYPDNVIKVIKQLRDLGIRIALDDFGTGYSSLHYLQKLPINILKIDKTFIDSINSTNTANHMVAGIISLSHQLGVKVVAEGVESEEQLNYLAKHKCDYIQGFLLSRPLEEEQVLASIITSMTG